MKRYSWLAAVFLIAGCGDANKEVAKEKPLAILEEEFGRLSDALAAVPALRAEPRGW